MVPTSPPSDPQPDLSRLAALPPLAAGPHAPDEGQACLLEAVAFVAGEPWSDRPACVCPVLADFGRAWNDRLPDGLRDDVLRPLVPRLVGTRTTPEVARAREALAFDWLLRNHLAYWLHEAGFTLQAEALESLPAITAAPLSPAALDALHAATISAGFAVALIGAETRQAATDATFTPAGTTPGLPIEPAFRELRWAATAAAAAAAAVVVGDVGFVAARDRLASRKRDRIGPTLRLFEAMIDLRAEG